MKKIILVFLLVFPVISFSQNDDDSLKKLLILYQEISNNQSEIDELLDGNPELKKVLDLYFESKIKNKGSEQKSAPLNFTEEYFEAEAEKIKYILSAENLDNIRSLYNSILESQYAQDISELVLEQMQKAKADLEEAIKEFERPKK